MGSGWTFFQILSKKYMKTKVVALCVLFLPILVCGILFLSSDYVEENTISVAMYFAEDGAYNDLLMEHLEAVEDFSFVAVDSEEELKAGIVDGSWLQGYVVEEGFSDAIADVKMKKTVRLVKLPDNIYYTQINEALNGAVFRLLTPIIAEEIVESRDIVADEAEIKERIATHLIAEDAFVIDMEYGIATGNVEQNNSQTMQIVESVICIFLLILVCTSTVFVMENRRAIRQLEPFLGRAKANVYFALPVYVYGFLSAVLSLCLVAIFGNGEIGLLVEFVRLLMFVIGLILFFGAVALWVPLEIFVALIPFALVGVCITHPILFDFTVFFPKAKYILQFLPTYQYLTFYLGDPLYWILSIILYALLIVLGSWRDEGKGIFNIQNKMAPKQTTQGGTKMKFCDQCGTKLEDGSQFCPKCGENMERTPKNPMRKDPANRKVMYIAMLVMILAMGVYGVMTRDDEPEVEDATVVVEEMAVEEMAVEEAEVVTPEVVLEELIAEEVAVVEIEEMPEEMIEEAEELLEEVEEISEEIEEITEEPAEETTEQPEVVEMTATEVAEAVLGVWDPISNKFQSEGAFITAVYQSGDGYSCLAGTLGGETYTGTMDLDSMTLLSDGVYQVGVNGNDLLNVIYFNIADVSKGVLYVGMTPDSWIPCSFVSKDLDEGLGIMETTYLQ